MSWKFYRTILLEKKKKEFQGQLDKLHKQDQIEWKFCNSKSEEVVSSFFALTEGETPFFG